MLLSGISSRGSGVKSMTVADQDRRARKFGHIGRKSSDLGPGLEQTKRVAAADFSQREKRGKVRSAGFRAVRLVLFLLPVTVVFVAGCGSPKAASPLPSPEVEVASVVQKDVSIYSEWVATLDGYVNAQIQPQVTGYVIRQTYKEGSFVRKGQILFQIDPRPFQAFLDQENAQLAQAQAQLGKTQMDVDRDTPLAKARAIAQSQLDNDVQANRAAQAGVKAAEAQVEQAKLSLEFTDVKSLLDGISGIAQVQIGNLVNPTTVLTSVSQINPTAALTLAFLNSGQACAAGSRLLVPRSRLDEVKRAIRDEMRAFPVDDPADPNTMVGPMVSQKQYERVESYIRKGIEEGAEVLVGGEGHPKGLEAGCFAKPTVFVNVKNGMTIAQEEIFGPVLSVIAYDSEDEAIRIANDSKYGLHSAVLGTDIQRARRVASHLRAGRVVINNMTDDPQAPWGGFKYSGVGREYGKYGIEAFLEPRAILE